MLVRTAADVGAIIQQARLSRKLSQAELGKRLGLHQPKISAIERGKSGASMETVIRVLDALQLSISIIEAAGADHRVTVIDAEEPSYDDDIDLDAITKTGVKE